MAGTCGAVSTDCGLLAAPRTLLRTDARPGRRRLWVVNLWQRPEGQASQRSEPERRGVEDEARVAGGRLLRR